MEKKNYSSFNGHFPCISEKKQNAEFPAYLLDQKKTNLSRQVHRKGRKLTKRTVIHEKVSNQVFCLSERASVGELLIKKYLEDPQSPFEVPVINIFVHYLKTFITESQPFLPIKHVEATKLCRRYIEFIKSI